MFKELTDLGKKLQSENKLVPFGYYQYGEKEKIKWVIHVWDQPVFRFHIEKTEIKKPMPYAGRTNNSDIAYPFVDQAAFALGVKRGQSKPDKKASAKHKTFISLLKTAYRSDDIKNKDVRRAILTLHNVLCRKRIVSNSDCQRIIEEEMLSKDWVTFVFEQGSLKGEYLFENADIKRFWSNYLLIKKTKKVDDKPIEGDCSVCGEKVSMAKNLPGVKLYKPVPLHSYNKDSFVSFMTGTSIFKKAHLGQCVVCGDAIARVLNYLTDNTQHYKIIIKDKKAGKLNTDSPLNQFAIFWLKENMSLKVGEIEIDPSVLLQNITAILAREQTSEKDVPPPDLKQIEVMLNSPWTARDSALRIADNVFCLLVLSPNKGRISPREWFSVSLDSLKQNLCQFLDSQRIISPDGTQKRSFPLPAILKGVEASNLSKKKYQVVESPNPNLSRSLLRCAYLGEPPPSGLLEEAVNCMRNPKIMKKENADTLHAVAAVLKMILTFNTEEAGKMEQLDSRRSNKGYLCGKLLAVLEEAQLRSARWRINTTLVDRFYGSASSAPMSVFGLLVSRATTDHFPKIRKNQLGYIDLENTIEYVQTQIDESGGYPKTLTLAGQAEFSLGFYHQRAEFKKKRSMKNENNNEEVKNND